MVGMGVIHEVDPNIMTIADIREVDRREDTITMNIIMDITKMARQIMDFQIYTRLLRTMVMDIIKKLNNIFSHAISNFA